ncbi:MAG: hypothetical protein E2O79_01650 [Caldithrix sp.]|nr:MAG: hypothetical protein E2O79_01650 [Caldithrix sp.]
MLLVFGDPFSGFGNPFTEISVGVFPFIKRPRWGRLVLKIREVEVRPQYEHWLGTLFVAEPRRRMGIGSLLVGGRSR